ncbi:uncharacterized protein TNCV_3268491 [Trichonephila clavipes]|nr:uncharacterized protein TNCV_3268491 [Trichonephila clavipes]
MAKRKRGITGDAARRRMALRARERKAAETVEERKKGLAAMAQCNQERRAEETEEQRSRRLAAMAQRDQERRAQETEEQRSHRLSTMAQHARRRRVNVTEEQNCLQVQTFYAARTFLYPVVEEHNCGKMENYCLKCGDLYFGAQKNARGAYTHCCHNGNWM